MDRVDLKIDFTPEKMDQGSVLGRNQNSLRYAHSVHGSAAPPLGIDSLEARNGKFYNY